MADHIHIDGQNEDAEFEREDLGAKPILIFLLALAMGCVLVALILKGMYLYLDAYENHHQAAQNPLVQETTTDRRTVAPSEVLKFPQPRLETNEPSEINDFRM